MSNGTHLKDVYCARLHKSNAQETLDNARDMITYSRDRLLILAAMTPMAVNDGDGETPWPDYVRNEINDIMDELQEHVVTAFQAQYILDWPDDCKDELVPADWPKEEDGQ